MVFCGGDACASQMLINNIIHIQSESFEGIGKLALDTDAERDHLELKDSSSSSSSNSDDGYNGKNTGSANIGSDVAATGTIGRRSGLGMVDALAPRLLLLRARCHLQDGRVITFCCIVAYCYYLCLCTHPIHRRSLTPFCFC